MTLTDDTLNNLRTQLVAGVAQSNRRRTRRKMVAIAPVAAVAIALGLVAYNGDRTPAYALTELADGTLRVEVFPEFEDVDALQLALHDAGIEATVIHLRAAPSLVGVIELSGHSNEASGALEFDNGEFVIDAGSVEGALEILIYSETEAGDDYQAAPSVFAPGQALAGLHCASVDGPLLTADLEARARAAGLTELSWTVFGEVDSASGAVAAEDVAERPDGFVTGAQMLNARTLWVSVSASATGPASSTIGMSDGTHYRDTKMCTPELAANWN